MMNIVLHAEKVLSLHGTRRRQQTHLSVTCSGTDLSNLPKACLTLTAEWTSWTRHTSTHLYREQSGRLRYTTYKRVCNKWQNVCTNLCKSSMGKEEDRVCRLLQVCRHTVGSSFRASPKSRQSRQSGIHSTTNQFKTPYSEFNRGLACSAYPTQTDQPVLELSLKCFLFHSPFARRPLQNLWNEGKEKSGEYVSDFFIIRATSRDQVSNSLLQQWIHIGIRGKTHKYTLTHQPIFPLNHELNQVKSLN